jgi:integrase
VRDGLTFQPAYREGVRRLARRYILLHGKRHPAEMGAEEITRFLSFLATARKVSASTQNQALAALLFLYRIVLDMEVPSLDDIVRAKRAVRVPIVMSRSEVVAVLGELRGMPQLMAVLLYGAGLRLLECARLRVKDVDFDRCQLIVRAGKGIEIASRCSPRWPGIRCGTTSSGWRGCTATTSPAATAGSSCRSLSHGSIRGRDATGRPSGRPYDDDLYPRPRSWSGRRPQSRRSHPPVDGHRCTSTLYGPLSPAIASSDGRAPHDHSKAMTAPCDRSASEQRLPIRGRLAGLGGSVE